MAFKSASAFTSWLSGQHAKSTGIWLRIAKKGSGIVSVSASDAVDAAICFGWIDGQLQRAQRSGRAHELGNHRLVGHRRILGGCDAGGLRQVKTLCRAGADPCVMDIAYNEEQQRVLDAQQLRKFFVCPITVAQRPLHGQSYNLSHGSWCLK